MSMNHNLRIASGAALALLSAALTIGPARAEDPPVTLRFSHWSPPQHPMSTISVPEWVNAVEKASNGSIKIQVFPAQQLGKAIDHYDMARDGLVDISWINAGFQPGRFPIAQALEMPWLYKDPQKMTLAFEEWYRPYAEKEMKDVKVCQLQILFPSIVHTKKEIKTPADFKALKVRVANSTQSRYLSGLGSVHHSGARNRGARRDRKGRRRSHAVPVALAGHLRHRQSADLPHGCAVLRQRLRVHHEQELVQQAVAAIRRRRSTTTATASGRRSSWRRGTSRKATAAPNWRTSRATRSIRCRSSSAPNCRPPPSRRRRNGPRACARAATIRTPGLEERSTAAVKKYGATAKPASDRIAHAMRSRRNDARLHCFTAPSIPAC